VGFPETEAGFAGLLTATGVSVLDGHTIGINDTLTVNAVSLTWNTIMEYFYGAPIEATPVTRTYDTITTFLEATYGITSAEVNISATITWLTGTIDRLSVKFATGDWIGAVMDEAFSVVGTLGGYSIIAGIFSLGAYQYSGPYATFGVWLFIWGAVATQVHGYAQAVAVILFTLGLGIAVAKLYLDRRTT
jgi:hypothetical protein